jgi:LPXTG-site transpeptidase (sortase) family protein
MKKIIVIFAIGLLLLSGSILLLLNLNRTSAGARDTVSISTPSNMATAPTAAAPKTDTAVSRAEAPGRIEGTPVKLDLPTLGVTLTVAPGNYDPATKTWSISTTKAHFANLTTKPNNIQGNTLIYGHYRSNVFAPLRKLKTSELAIVTTDNGRVFYYQLSTVRTVDPTDSADVLATDGQPTLTLQTCTGLFYEKRQLFIFNLQRVA